MKVDDLVIKRVFNCSKRSLFDAWSQAALMAQWFFAAPSKVKDSTVTSHFRIGGEWSVTMYFDDGSQANLHGSYKTINRYTEIAFSWNSPIASNGTVKLFLKELSVNRTELTLVHSDFISEENRQMHNQGWDACLANLEKFIKASHSE